MYGHIREFNKEVKKTQCEENKLPITKGRIRRSRAEKRKEVEDISMKSRTGRCGRD